MAGLKGLSQGFSIVSILILCMLSTSQVLCQNGTTNDGQMTKVAARPIDEGMEPLYSMTKVFLNLVQPESRGSIAKILDLKSLGE